MNTQTVEPTPLVDNEYTIQAAESAPRKSYNPDEDGITHINVYSKGKTELGRLLSNFAETPFKHEKYGYFASMEGYWYFVKTGCEHDELRRLYGASAKAQGMRFHIVPIEDDEFKTLICQGITAKIRQNPTLEKMLAESQLPLTHYLVYGSKVVPLPQHSWQMECLEDLRRELKLEHSKENSSGL